MTATTGWGTISSASSSSPYTSWNSASSSGTPRDHMNCERANHRDAIREASTISSDSRLHKQVQVAHLVEDVGTGLQRRPSLAGGTRCRGGGGGRQRHGPKEGGMWVGSLISNGPGKVLLPSISAQWYLQFSLSPTFVIAILIEFCSVRLYVC